MISSNPKCGNWRVGLHDCACLRWAHWLLVVNSRLLFWPLSPSMFFNVFSPLKHQNIHLNWKFTASILLVDIIHNFRDNQRLSAIFSHSGRWWNVRYFQFFFIGVYVVECWQPERGGAQKTLKTSTSTTCHRSSRQMTIQTPSAAFPYKFKQHCSLAYSLYSIF